MKFEKFRTNRWGREEYIADRHETNLDRFDLSDGAIVAYGEEGEYYYKPLNEYSKLSEENLFAIAGKLNELNNKYDYELVARRPKNAEITGGKPVASLWLEYPAELRIDDVFVGQIFRTPSGEFGVDFTGAESFPLVSALREVALFVEKWVEEQGDVAVFDGVLES